MEQVQDTSNISPMAFIGLLVAAYLIWTLPRRLAVCPILAMVCLMPLGQDLVVFGLHFYLFRVLLLVGVLRVLLKHEARQLVMTRTDRIFIWWIIVSIVFGTLAKPSMELFINRLGDAYNAFGMLLSHALSPGGLWGSGYERSRPGLAEYSSRRSDVGGEDDRA